MTGFGAGLIFDLVMVLVLVLSIIIGRKKGLLITLFTAGIILIAVILANIVSTYVAKGIEKWKISENVNSKLFKTINNTIKEENVDFDGLTKKYKIPESVANVIEKKAEDIKNAKGEALAKKIADKLTEIIIKVLSFVIVAMAVLILLILIATALKIVSKLPLIGKVDKLGGALAGLVLGLSLIFVACVLIYFISFLNIGKSISEIASTSYAMKIIDKLGLIKGIIK